MKKTQKDRILDYMRIYGGITQLQALRDLGCMRLASRISDMKRDGEAICSEMVGIKNRFGETVYVKKYVLCEDGAK